MPIVVDKAERRARVIALAFDLVAERGIEALTFREIAAAAECSTSIVSHYFRNKNELLFSVYRHANMRARERVDAAVAAGLPLVECYEAILPTEVESRANWRVWLAFWGRAHLEPEYLEERRRAAEESLALYRQMLAARAGSEARVGDIDGAARRLLASLAGIALEGCFAPADWTPERMRTVLAAELADLGYAGK